MIFFNVSMVIGLFKCSASSRVDLDKVHFSRKASISSTRNKDNFQSLPSIIGYQFCTFTFLSQKASYFLSRDTNACIYSSEN